MSAAVDEVSENLGARLDELARKDLRKLTDAEAKFIRPRVCSCPVLLKSGKKVVAMRCRNFRESVCPHCSGIKAGDTNRIIHAGIAKANARYGSDGWIVFITLTLGSNGRVHRTRTFKVKDEIFGNKQVSEIPCAPCGNVVHDQAEGLHATPVDPDNYDYAKQVVENQNVSELFRITIKSFNEKLENATGLKDCMRYCRVVELQERFSPHIHCIAIVPSKHMKALGGKDAFADKFRKSAQVQATTLAVQVLERQLRRVEKDLTLSLDEYQETIAWEADGGLEAFTPRDLFESRNEELTKRKEALESQLEAIPENLRKVAWGKYVDLRFIQPLNEDATEEEIGAYKLTRARVAKYLAKYITKSLAANPSSLTPAQKRFQERIADEARVQLRPQYEEAVARLEAKRDTIDPYLYARELFKAEARFERLVLAGGCNAQRFTTSRNWSDLNYKKLQQGRAEYMTREDGGKVKAPQPTRDSSKPPEEWTHDGSTFQRNRVLPVEAKMSSKWLQVYAHHRPSSAIEMAALHVAPRLGIDGYGALGQNYEAGLRCMQIVALKTKSALLPVLEERLAALPPGTALPAQTRTSGRRRTSVVS